MPRFGITGHVNLTLDSITLVEQAIHDRLKPYAGLELTGLSCIAPGADTIFAQVVLDLGGRLEVVVPAADYREKVIGPTNLTCFDELIERAADVRVLPFAQANRDAYEAANLTMVSTSDRLLAVWDGNNDARKGTTASVVAYARVMGVPVEVVWPEGARRCTRVSH